MHAALNITTNPHYVKKRSLREVMSTTARSAEMPFALSFVVLQDPEAQMLLEKIRGLNPRADIASMVRSSTPPACSRNVRTRRPLSGGGVLAAASPPTLPLRNRVADQASSMNKRGGVLDDPALDVAPSAEITGRISISPRPPGSPRRSGRQTLDGQEVVDIPGAHGSSEEGVGSDLVNRSGENGLGERVEVDHDNANDDDDDKGIIMTVGHPTPRSLMGRMLGNGTSMLERQKAWVRARSKKVR